MIYRVIQRLSVGSGLSGYVEPGGMVSDASLGREIARILAKKGAISPVKAPPLSALPGWKLRAKKFEAAGYDAISLLESDAALIARETGYRERSIDGWKRELMGFLEIRPGTVRRGCCGKRPAPEPEPIKEVLELTEDEEEEFETEEQEETQQVEEVTDNATDE